MVNRNHKYTLMRTLTDHTDRIVQVPDLPQRVISLCPSQSAPLAALRFFKPYRSKHQEFVLSQTYKVFETL
jgi:ABC-type Fe3+-hydroxamate transport system substrate-binding protein